MVALGLRARLITNHDVMRPAFRLFEIGSPSWWSLVEMVRSLTIQSAMSVCQETSVVFTGVVVDGQTRDLRYLEQLSILARHAGNTGIFAVTLTADETVRKARMTDATREYPQLIDWKIGQLLPYHYDLGTDDFYESVGATHLIVDTNRRSAAESAEIIIDAVRKWSA
jgi:hypothetical protein